MAWAGSTAFLLQKSYFPDLGRFPRVANSRVADLYFDRGQTTDLLLLMERKGAVGRLTVTPRRHSLRLAEAAFRGAAGEVFFTGRFDPARIPGAPSESEVVWNGSLFLNRDLGNEGLRLQLRFPQLNLMGQLTLESQPWQLNYQLKQGADVLADSRDQEKIREFLNQFLLAAKLAGLAMPGPEALQDGPALWQSLAPQVVCRHGRFTILGRRYDGYVVRLQWSPEAHLNLLFTELGELLRLEGVPRIDILAESFVPAELMEPEEGIDDP